jgi:regulator of replication initiation timing
MDHPLDQQAKRVNEKLQTLLKQYHSLGKENEKLKQEIKLSAGRHHALSAELDRLQQKLELLKLSKGEMSDPEKKVFEKRINGYLKEIDRCIGLLNE